MNDTQTKIEQLERRLNELNGFFDQKLEEDGEEVPEIIDKIEELEFEIKKLKMQK